LQKTAAAARQQQQQHHQCEAYTGRHPRMRTRY
jgi:hypothetical protein